MVPVAFWWNWVSLYQVLDISMASLRSLIRFTSPPAVHISPREPPPPSKAVRTDLKIGAVVLPVLPLHTNCLLSSWRKRDPRFFTHVAPHADPSLLLVSQQWTWFSLLLSLPVGLSKQTQRSPSPRALLQSGQIEPRCPCAPSTLPPLCIYTNAPPMSYICLHHCKRKPLKLLLGPTGYHQSA